MSNTTTSQNAMCITCGEQWTDQYDSRKLGYAHAKKFKHDVTVEVCRGYSYDFTEETPNEQAD